MTFIPSAVCGGLAGLMFARARVWKMQALKNANWLTQEMEHFEARLILCESILQQTQQELSKQLLARKGSAGPPGPIGPMGPQGPAGMSLSNFTPEQIKMLEDQFKADSAKKQYVIQEDAL